MKNKHLGIRRKKAMASHSSTLNWKIPWMEEPGGLQSMGSLRVGHDWATSILLFTFTFHFHALEKEMATHCSCLENPRDGGACWAAVYGVAQSRTRLKRLRSSSRHKEAGTFRGRSIRLPVSFTVHQEERHLCQEFHTLSVYHPSFTRREEENRHSRDPEGLSSKCLV